jgi:LysM repeat protein
MKTIDIEDDHRMDDHFRANELRDELDDDNGGLMRLFKPLGWMLLGVVVMVAIFVLTLTWRGSSKQVPQLAISPESDQRVDALEERLSRLETAQAAIPSTATEAGLDPESKVRLDQLAGRMDRLEALVTEQFEKVDERLQEVAKTEKRAATAPPTPKPAPKAAVSKPAASGEIYTVKSGDTLYSVSTRFGVSVDRLKQLNNITGNTIRPGQSLRVK